MMDSEVLRVRILGLRPFGISLGGKPMDVPNTAELRAVLNAIVDRLDDIEERKKGE